MKRFIQDGREAVRDHRRGDAQPLKQSCAGQREIPANIVGVVEAGKSAIQNAAMALRGGREKAVEKEQ